MEKGRNIAMVPGGFEEASISSKKRLTLYIRKGFMKYALQYGYGLYPTMAFGEEKAYNVIEGFDKFKLFLNKFKIPGVFFYSKNGILPNFDIKIDYYIGKIYKIR